MNSKPALIESLAMLGCLALSGVGCGHDVLVGVGEPGADGMGGAASGLDFGGRTGGTGGLGGQKGAYSSSGGASASGGGPAVGGSVGSGGATGGGSGGTTSSGWGYGNCPTITTTPGQTNPCGNTTGVAFSPDGTLLATATQTNTPYVHVWRLSDGKLLYEPDGGSNRDGAYSVAFSPDGKLLASAGTAPRTVVNGVSSQADTDTVDIWDAATGARLVILPTHCGDYATAATFSHDGKHLVTAGASAAIEIWNVADWSLALTIPYTTYSIYAARYSPDDSRLITTSASINTIWNASDGTKVAEISGLIFEMNYADYAPNGSLIVSTAGDGKIQILDPSGLNLQTMVFRDGPSPLPWIEDVRWIGNDAILADDTTGMIQEWKRDPSSTAPLFVFAQSWMIADGGTRMAVAPDQSRFVIGGSVGFTFVAP